MPLVNITCYGALQNPKPLWQSFNFNNATYHFGVGTSQDAELPTIWKL